MSAPSVQNTSADANKLPIIPEITPTRRRTLVLCFDGTGDQFDADNSNVVQFFSLLQKDSRAEQMVYYQAGIGTYTVPQIATPFYARISKAMDAAIAWNLDAHLMDGYTFLMQNYQAGDKICIFGFSRGAYTARALAGMIHKIGLLPACNHQQVPFAYNMYARTDEIGWKQSVAFKKAFSVDVDVEFVGVWDTVSSVGLIPKRLPFVCSNTAIRYFRHAVSLDEHRAKFKANLYNRPTEAEAKLGVQPGEMPKSSAAPPAVTSLSLETVDTIKKWVYSTKGSGEEEEEQDDRLEVMYDVNPVEQKKETDVLEVWFAGCHCDVGGGSVSNDTPHNLARIPLRWMIRQCFAANTGIRFHTQLLRNIGLDPASLYPVVKDRPPEISATAEKLAALGAASDERQAAPASPVLLTPTSTTTLVCPAPALHERTDSARTLVNGQNSFDSDPLKVPVAPTLTEEEEDLLDIVCPIYDQLELAKSWWILEVVPLMQRYQLENNEWAEDLMMNLGRPRDIPRFIKDGKIKVHRSVKMRMEAEGLVEIVGAPKGGSYKPRPTLPPVEQLEWVS